MRKVDELINLLQQVYKMECIMKLRIMQIKTRYI